MINHSRPRASASLITPITQRVVSHSIMESQAQVTILFKDVLIEKVRLFSHLYMTSSNKHKDVVRNESSWSSIAASINEMGWQCSADSCKVKWHYQRDNYIKKKRDYNSRKSGDGARNGRISIS